MSTTTTTTSTTTTIATPVKKLIETNNNKVEETKETTTTTTTIKTISTPMKEEPKKNRIVNKVWSDKDYIRVQLFRDLNFGRYGPTTQATKIHADPEREYSEYNIGTIQKKVREVRLLVSAHREGVWLDKDPMFRERCELQCLPTAEEKKGREEEYERWEKLHPKRMALYNKDKGLSRNDVGDLLGDLVALSVKSGAVKL